MAKKPAGPKKTRIISKSAYGSTRRTGKFGIITRRR